MEELVLLDELEFGLLELELPAPEFAFRLVPLLFELDPLAVPLALVPLLSEELEPPP